MSQHPRDALVERAKELLAGDHVPQAIFQEQGVSHADYGYAHGVVHVPLPGMQSHNEADAALLQPDDAHAVPPLTFARPIALPDPAPLWPPPRPLTGPLDPAALSHAYTRSYPFALECICEETAALATLLKSMWPVTAHLAQRAAQARHEVWMERYKYEEMRARTMAGGSAPVAAASSAAGAAMTNALAEIGARAAAPDSTPDVSRRTLPARPRGSMWAATPAPAPLQQQQLEATRSTSSLVLPPISRSGTNAAAATPAPPSVRTPATGAADAKSAAPQPSEVPALVTPAGSPLTRPLSIGLVGAGRVGSAVARAMLERDVVIPARFRIATRRPATCPSFAAASVPVEADVADIAPHCALIIVATGAHQLPAVGASLAAASARNATTARAASALVSPALLSGVDPNCDANEVRDEGVMHVPTPEAEAAAAQLTDPDDTAAVVREVVEAEGLEALALGMGADAPPAIQAHAAHAVALRRAELAAARLICLHMRLPLRSLPDLQPAVLAPLCTPTGDLACIPMFFSICAGVGARKVRATLKTPFAARTRVPLAHAHAGLAHLLHSSQIALLKALEGALPVVRQLLVLEVLRYLHLAVELNKPAYTLALGASLSATCAAGLDGDATWGALAQLDAAMEDVLHSLVATLLPQAFPLLRAACSGESAGPLLAEDPVPLSFATAGTPLGSFAPAGIPYTAP